jgi:hypothetical protein
LDYAKLCFYKFPYKLGEICNAKFLYSDTDSISVGFLDDGYKEAMKKLADEFLDLSSLDPDDELYSDKNKGIVLKWKIEGRGFIDSYIGLTAKMYAIRYKDDVDDLMKAKGIPRNVLKRNLTFEKYREMLNSAGHVTVNYNAILRKNICNIVTQKMNRTMTAFDDKKYFTPDVCLPLGHYRTKDHKNI